MWRQRVAYDFEFFSLDQPADAPVTVLSLGRSLLKDAAGVAVPLRPTAPLGARRLAAPRRRRRSRSPPARRPGARRQAGMQHAAWARCLCLSLLPFVAVIPLLSYLTSSRPSLYPRSRPAQPTRAPWRRRRPLLTWSYCAPTWRPRAPPTLPYLPTWKLSCSRVSLGRHTNAARMPAACARLLAAGRPLAPASIIARAAACCQPLSSCPHRRCWLPPPVPPPRCRAGGGSAEGSRRE